MTGSATQTFHFAGGDDLARLTGCLHDCEIDLDSLGAPIGRTWSLELRRPAPHGDPQALMFSWSPGKWPCLRVRVEIRGVERYRIDDAEGIGTYLVREVEFDRDRRVLRIQTQLDACVELIVSAVNVIVEIDADIVPAAQTPHARAPRFQRIVVWILLACALVGAIAIGLIKLSPRARAAITESGGWPRLMVTAFVLVVLVASPVIILILRDLARTTISRGRMARATGQVLAAPTRFLGLLAVLFGVMAVGLTAYNLVTGALFAGPLRFIVAIPHLLIGYLYGRFGLSMMRSPLAPIAEKQWLSGDSEAEED